jgi:hypothetical protein
MGHLRAIFHWRALRSLLLILETMSLVCVCGIAAATAAPQDTRPARGSETDVRLLSREEGRSIVHMAWQAELPADGMRDCSHVVHQIYADAGFEYPYASSLDIYVGNESFVRVKTAHAGDVIAWPGHVGIVVDPLQHSFYSLVRTGLDTQDYESPYWKSRGRPRFYRYRVENGGVVTAADTTGAPKVAVGHAHTLETTVEERTATENGSSNRPPAAASERSTVIYGPPAPHASPVAKSTEALAIPPTVIVTAGNKPPTREEVAEGISALTDPLGSVLGTDDVLNVPVPVVIVEQFSVEQVKVKRDHGWARVAVDSRVMISGGTVQVKHRQEKVRWEVRRTVSGWEAVWPTNRIYIPHDAAVKNLAANLARLTSSDGAAERQQDVLRQESQLASLLNALLENKQGR